MTDARLHAVLAYLGTLPFIACAAGMLLGIPPPTALAGYPEIAAGYGLAIAAFVAGSHWGIYLYKAADTMLNLLLLSNGITVAAWLAFLLAPTYISLEITTAAFITLLMIDYQLTNEGVLSATYLRIRRNATIVVVAALIVTVVLA